MNKPRQSGRPPSETNGRQKIENHFRLFWRPEFIILLLLGVIGCSKVKSEIPDVTDEPLSVSVTIGDMEETVPTHGIAMLGSLEVNVEKEDAPKVSRGQKALALLGPDAPPLECRVSSVVQNVNTATGQAIAWLKPVRSAALPVRGFVSARIIVRVKRHALIVPREAVYVRDGQMMVLLRQAVKEGGETYVPTPVKTGITSGMNIEIVSGLKPGEEVATQAGIGYLYPDFKANAGD